MFKKTSITIYILFILLTLNVSAVFAGEIDLPIILSYEQGIEIR